MISSSWPAHWRGIAWILAAGVGFSLVNGLVKHLGQTLPALEVAFFRCLFGVTWILPLLARDRFAALATRRPLAHFLRGAAGSLAMWATFYGYAHLPLAQVTAISFSNPLFMVPFALLFLGEKPGWPRSLSTLLGFLGLLLMAQPGWVTFHPALLAAFASPVLVALVQVMIKTMTSTEAPLTILGWFSISATLLFLPVTGWIWQTPTPLEWAGLLLLGGVASAAQYCMILAYAQGEATLVTPFDYSRVIFSGMVGYFFFGEVPDQLTVTGAAIIALSTVAVARTGKTDSREESDDEEETISRARDLV